tara:strand:- start:3205 stop:3522 length:318 start_codon:yes stop_codon:yes gene_type:complete
MTNDKTTQKRNGVLVTVILCGGPLAPVSVNGYSGCNGTGWYRSPEATGGGGGFAHAPVPQKCFRCEGMGYQSKDQYYRNKAYDKRAEYRLGQAVYREATGGTFTA